MTAESAFRVVARTGSPDRAGALIESVRSELGRDPDWLVVDVATPGRSSSLEAALSASLAGAAAHVSSSCRGVMSGAGFESVDGAGLGVFAVSDPTGDYGVAARSLSGDPAAAAGAALIAAIDEAGRTGEAPALVWVNPVPGSEEAVLAGIRSTVGPHVPVFGGSSADNDVAGDWWQMCDGEALVDSVIVSALYPSVGVRTAFHSGYVPTRNRGRVSDADGRLIREVDGRPAAAVYADWTGDALAGASTEPGALLAASTMYPLGVPTAEEDGEELFRLVHPATLHADGALEVFADVAVGDEIVVMQGNVQALVTRAGDIVSTLVEGAADRTVHGALVTYCGGCMLAIPDRMDEVAASIREALGGVPFLGGFTFGEQGRLDCDNVHGNLMIGVVAFEG